MPEDSQQDKAEEWKKWLIITAENLSFSKMKTLMTIISWNPWDIDIEVLWNWMKISEKWLKELNKLLED